MKEEDKTLDKAFTDEVLPRVRRPRPAWQALVLLLCSFTLYSSFLMLGQVRDLKAVGGKDFTPWLWVFVPLIPLAQLIALPRFFKELTKLEDGSTTSAWKSLTWLWITILFVISLSIYYEDRLSLPLSALQIGFVVIALQFVMLHQRFNLWKQPLQNVNFYGSRSAFTWYEWILVVIGSPIVIAGIYMTVIEPLLVKEIRKLNNQQVIENVDLGFTLTVSGDGWSEVESGTHSTDETELELSGSVLNSFFIVFDHGISYSINDVARFRAELRDDFSRTPECNENRILSKNETSVISFTECKGTMLGEIVTTYSTIIKSNDRVLELYGYLSATKYTHSRESKYMRSIAREFSPL